MHRLWQKRFLYQYLAAASCNLNIIVSGMHYGWPSPSLPKLESNSSNIQITTDQESWLAIMVLMGALLGSSMGGLLVDHVGRKRTILISSIPYFASWMMIAYANSVYVLCAARFMAGVVDGWVFIATPMYIGEIAHPSIRGMLGSGLSTLWVLGIFIVNIIGSYLSIFATAIVSSVLPLLCFVTFLRMPESPYQCILKKKHDEAKRSLQVFRGVQDVEEELTNITLAVKEQTENTGRFLDLFTTPSNRKALGVMLILRGFQQLTGTSAITFYLQKIFIEAGGNISADISSTIFFGIQLLLCSVCSSIVDKTGRRPLLLSSILGSGISLFALGTYFLLKNSYHVDTSSFSAVPVAALLGFIIIFSLGQQAIPILIVGEIFPSNVKGFALAVCDLYFSVVASIVSKFFQIMNDSFGIYVPFYVFGSICLVGFVAIFIYVPETKGKTLEQIQEDLKAKGKQNLRSS